MMYLMAAAVILQAILAVIAFAVWWDVRKVRQALCAKARHYRESWVSSRLAWAGRPFAIWKYSDGSWRLETASVPAGWRPGPPPSFRGSYEGQCVKTECAKDMD